MKIYLFIRANSWLIIQVPRQLLPKIWIISDMLIKIMGLVSVSDPSQSRVTQISTVLFSVNEYF